ncbi:PREDICTED: tetratricopeptide repeat protein 36 isoform X1 [Thamnophis sirtalis]|uniref:Tetratricopeptide repeat protein 36 n=1 Tax=Thamnophis sirtalis TaxID=35019 RepID=A0A6I9YYR1_9SAUR|nr:PREDICTED: tetratricopeptide repeat protein 36 isoform X1 [Thamnophis sirtalis]
MVTIKDRAVLQTIFHPNVPFDEDYQEEPGKQQAIQEGGFDPELLRQATHLEAQGIAAAEGGDLGLALEKLSQAIQLLPARASAFNNRAQALRLKGDVAKALEDLEAALKLSRGAGPVARQGFVQRGLIQRLQGEDEAARSSFEQAAALGSSFARRQLALMNPYAALCNQMLSEVMRKAHPKGAKEAC